MLLDQGTLVTPLEYRLTKEAWAGNRNISCQMCKPGAVLTIDVSVLSAPMLFATQHTSVQEMFNQLSVQAKGKVVQATNQQEEFMNT